MKLNRLISVMAALALLAAALPFTTAARAASEANPAQAPSQAPMASGWTLIKFPQVQPVCAGAGFPAVYFDRLDCGFGYVSVSETTSTSTVKVAFIDSGGVTRNTQTTTFRAAEVAWEFDILPAAAWAGGPVTIRVTEVNGQTGNFGETMIFLNQLGATVAPAAGSYSPGDLIPVTGTTFEIDQIPPLAAPQQTNVGATFSLRVIWPDGTVRGPYGPFTASDVPGSSRGTFSASISGAATTGLTADASTNFKATVSIEVVSASYNDALTGAWAAARAGSGSVTLSVPPDRLILENSFVSSVGWVKPGQTYPFRVFVKNFRTTPESNVVVTIPVPDGTAFTQATAVAGSGTCSINGAGAINWNIGSVPAATAAGPAIKTCVVEARADTLGQDAQIVWKNLSSIATLTYTGGPANLTATSHGPKVIPPKAIYDTARYGDRPFPVVPVDYFDRKHAATHTGETLSNKINSPDIPGSTFSLYQEMSYQQLFPNGTVPSAGTTSAGWDYGPGFNFTSPAPQGICYGTSFKDVRNTPVYPERIVGGWYQLPGDTAYYGADQLGSALPGAIAGIGPLLQIDNACGPTGKAVYDAAQIADPEIDYSDYDTDKDGVVDFFMMVFVGIGGNGASQTSVPPYDNIWPHSSSLEFYYSNQAPYGQQGYVSDDQLKDLQGRPLYYTDASASTMTLTPTAFPVYVRVGPYNVNPESAIDNASVISHEYGHSLGLPDFYSLGSRETYGDWNLMATDKSQNMDVFSKQELGWLVPRVLQPGQTTVTGWQDTKRNTHQIDWVTPLGAPYTLSGTSVNNGEGYVAKLPARQILDPAKFDSAGPGEGASPDQVWWSQSGNDFGCTPTGAHNLDIYLPELANLTPGTSVLVTLKSYWDIEWDFDYGFVMISTDGGVTYTSLPSQNGYTTQQVFNPNANACQTQYGNGLTGTSGSFEAGTQSVDRVLGQYSDGGFLTDEYDLSSAAGSATVLRFSYATDPGLARPGWFIDDLRITAGGNVIYETDFETSGDPNDPRVFNGGCKGAGRIAALCTDGWQFVNAAEGSPADHAYYMEMRDRSSFDFDGKGENDRDPIAFLPGLLLVYTDEAHGYGNVGTSNPPAQTPLDSQPQPGNDTPNLHDAAWTAASGDNHFLDSGEGHTDNYTDPSNSDVDPLYPNVANPWRFRFNCLTFDVLRMVGNDIGPGTVPPYNLEGDVRFTIGDGCAPFDYGNGVPNQKPTAVAQARPTNPAVGETVTFDGSASFDDLTPTDDLTYEWDFDGNGTFDATGQTATHAYGAAGTYQAKLKVTDAGNLSDEDTITITVSANRPPVANDDSASVQRGGTVDINVLANDTDPDGDTLTVTSFSPPSHGSVTQNPNGTLKYTHDNSAATSDSFTYTVSDGNGRTDSATVTITVPPTNAPDLTVTQIKLSWDDDDDDDSGGPDSREGQKVKITATIKNIGNRNAPSSKTSFVLDGVTQLGLVNTPALAAGKSADVSVTWDTHGQPGLHTLSVTADANNAIIETNESNNSAQRNVRVRPNKVGNGDFEDDDNNDGRPDDWDDDDDDDGNDAGRTSWSQGGSHGERSASIQGNGGNAALLGAPSWTSAPIAVVPGETLTLSVWVNSTGTSSAASAGLAYLGPAGELLGTVTLITTPLATNGFQTLENTLVVPSGVAQVRLMLIGFAPTDLATSGTVTFDDVGLFGE